MQPPICVMWHAKTQRILCKLCMCVYTCVLLKIKPRASYMLHKFCSTELPLQPSFVNYIHVFILYVYAHTVQGAGVNGRRQLGGVSPYLFHVSSGELNSGHWAWQPVPLPTESSHLPIPRPFNFWFWNKDSPSCSDSFWICHPPVSAFQEAEIIGIWH